jgi:hypothetical protein
MTTKKNVGTRPRPKQRTPEEQRRHRAEQAARAILAGRGERDKHWERIARSFPDCGSADGATTFAHRLGLATVPAYLLDAAFPPAEPEPEPTPEPTPEVAVEPEPTPEPTPEPEPEPAAA